MVKFDPKSLDLIAEVHKEIVLSDDPAVASATGDYYPHSEALLRAGIAAVYPDLDIDEIRQLWQDDGFEPISQIAQYLRDQRAWLERINT